MKKYYILKLNCGRVRKICSCINDCGFIEILPQKGSIQTKGLFGTKNIPIIEYNGWFNIIAEQVDDHFEDIILQKRIDYDPDGLYDITNASTEELEEQLLDIGLTCHSFMEVDPQVALHYMNMIKDDNNILEKYVNELDELEKKNNITNEIESRLSGNEQLVNNTRNPKSKSRLKNIKSA